MTSAMSAMSDPNGVKAADVAGAKNAGASDADWWRGAVIYQVYPRSFFDSNGDGVGDLAGIEARLDAIAALHVDAIWISPFFKSPMEDFGYDVSDYCDVDPIFGDLDGFKRLLAGAHARGLRVLIDLVLSHTSQEHPWFLESRRDRTNPKADWYVWADATQTGNPPNNWLSLFGGGAWEWEPRRGQYYLHNFLKSQPDLNFHCAAVQEAVLETARFWLELGVDGFRLDVVNFYFHDVALRDNPPAASRASARTVQQANPYARQEHIYDKNRPENLKFLGRFRALLDAFPGSTTVGELGADSGVPELTEAYTEGGRRLHQLYNFELMTKRASVRHIRTVVERMEAHLKTGWVSWAVSNHDFARVVSRWGYEDCPDAAAPLIIALMASLRGSPCLYQGEELGLAEAEIDYEDLQDPYGRAFWPEYKGRDGCRTPFPWRHDAPAAGFSRAKPWLPVPTAHCARAFDLQERDPASALRRTRQFLWWRRRQRPLITGELIFIDTPEPVLAFIRSVGDARILCLFNLGRAPVLLAPPTGGRLIVDAESGFTGSVSHLGITLDGVNALFCHLTETQAGEP